MKILVCGSPTKGSRLRNDLLGIYVEWDVKPYTHTHSPHQRVVLRIALGPRSRLQEQKAYLCLVRPRAVNQCLVRRVEGAIVQKVPNVGYI